VAACAESGRWIEAVARAKEAGIADAAESADAELEEAAS